MKPSAPLGQLASTQRLCTRIIDFKNGEEVLCGEPATVHVIHRWDPLAEGQNPDERWDHGFACDEHWADYEQRWVSAAHHPVRHCCGMPGSWYSFDMNECFIENLPVAEPNRAIAVPA